MRLREDGGVRRNHRPLLELSSEAPGWNASTAHLYISYVKRHVVKLIGLTVLLPCLLCEFSFGLRTAMIKTRETTSTVRVRTCVLNAAKARPSSRLPLRTSWEKQLPKRHRQRVSEFTEFSLKCQKKVGLFWPSLRKTATAGGPFRSLGLDFFFFFCGSRPEPGPHYLWPGLLWVAVSPTTSSSTTLT